MPTEAETPVERRAGTICKCGLAKSYHGPNPPNLADHEWEPRYDADSYASGFAAGRAAALGGLDAERLARADWEVFGGARASGSTWDDLDDKTKERTLYYAREVVREYAALAAHPAEAEPPVIEVEGADGVKHRVWDMASHPAEAEESHATDD